MSTRPSFHIETFGCQMNERDSEIMAQLLSEGARPCLDINEADIVLVNTCSIREKAAHKAISLLGQLRAEKGQRRRNPIVGVVGCLAQQEGQALLRRLPHVSLVIGPQNIYQLPALLAEAAQGRRLVAVDQSSSFVIPPLAPQAGSGPPHKRFITIMQGCDNFCTYCVVPYTRGREISRDLDQVVAEARTLVEQGVKELILLGQNVNSYGRKAKEGERRTFAELLRAVARLPGLERLRFTSSNPQDLTHELLLAFAELPVLCPHFHLPVQSGSNRVLARMNRRYTRERYLELIAELRSHRPGIAITTDLIVGFPGETEADFDLTCQLVTEVRYHGAFSFKYSDRPQAKAAGFADKVAEEVKARRLSILQGLIDRMAWERNQEFLGRTERVMVEGASPGGQAGQWQGRTGSSHLVHFVSPVALAVGDLLDVRITGAGQHSLRGELP
ncbi:MAG: tRNA (N6-isopentenyl adenosine(37)-C2)-methylthiotransferase MiaB [Desulfobacteraceae bacterium]|nr:tRNA (N6-isopentenyl adenosine(37)-C2)-methylthiotransferase MiaB [Desulfobacteraceae bacterium]